MNQFATKQNSKDIQTKTSKNLTSQDYKAPSIDSFKTQLYDSNSARLEQIKKDSFKVSREKEEKIDDIKFNDKIKITNISQTTTQKEDDASYRESEAVSTVYTGTVEVEMDKVTTSGEVTITNDATTGYSFSAKDLKIKAKFKDSDFEMKNINLDTTKGTLIAEESTLNLNKLNSKFLIKESGITDGGLSFGSVDYSYSKEINIIPDYLKVSDLNVSFGKKDKDPTKDEYGVTDYSATVSDVKDSYFNVSGKVNLNLEGTNNFKSDVNAKIEKNLTQDTMSVEIEKGNFETTLFGQDFKIEDLAYSGGEFETDKVTMDLKFLKSKVELGSIRINNEEGFVIDEGSFTQTDPFYIVKDHLSIKDFKLEWGSEPGVLPFMREDYFRGEGTLDATSEKFKSSGTFKVTKVDPEENAGSSLKFSIDNGNLEADISGQILKLESVSYEDSTLKSSKASLDLKALDTMVEVSDTEISSAGGITIGGGKVTINKEKELIKDFLKMKSFTFETGKDLLQERYFGISSDLEFTNDKVKGSIDEAALKLSSSRFEASIKKLNLKTPIFGMEVNNAKLDQDGFYAVNASVELGNKISDKKEQEKLQDFIPGIDFSIFEYVGAMPRFKAEHIRYSSTEGFSVGRFTPEMPIIKFNKFGIDAELDIVKRTGHIKGQYEFPKNMPGWPFNIEARYPVLPGLEVYAGFGAFGGLKVGLGAEVQREEGVDSPWEFTGNANFHGDLGVKVAGGVTVGSKFIAGLSGELYADAVSTFDANGTLKGSFLHDKKTSSFKFQDNPTAMYDLSAVLKSSVGAKLKVQALYFFEKEIVDYKFKEWTLGEFLMTGSVAKNDQGKYVHDNKKSGFVGKPKGPSVEYSIKKGEEAEELLRQAALEIDGSGVARKEVIEDVESAYMETIKVAVQRVDHENKRLGHYKFKHMEVSKKIQPALEKHEKRLAQIDKTGKDYTETSKGFFGNKTKTRTKEHEEKRLNKYKSKLDPINESIEKHERRIRDLINLINKSAEIAVDVNKAISDLKALEKGNNLGVIEKTEDQDSKVQDGIKKVNESSKTIGN